MYQNSGYCTVPLYKRKVLLKRCRNNWLCLCVMYWGKTETPGWEWHPAWGTKNISAAAQEEPVDATFPSFSGIEKIPQNKMFSLCLLCDVCLFGLTEKKCGNSFTINIIFYHRYKCSGFRSHLTKPELCISLEQNEIHCTNIHLYSLLYNQCLGFNVDFVESLSSRTKRWIQKFLTLVLICTK